MTAEEREEIVQKKHEERDTFEKAHLGKYKMIYPCDNIERMQAYAEFQQAAQEDWEDFTTGKRRRGTTIPNSTFGGRDPNDIRVKDELKAAA